MNRTPAYLVGALLLIALGVLMLLANLEILPVNAGTVFGILFLAGGLVFLAVFATSRQVNWWAAIPGFVLAAIGILILFGDQMGAWAGALVLGGIALAFFVVFFNNRAFWWALIPAGVMTTLTLLIGLSGREGPVQGELFAGLLFLGIGLTFLAVYFLPTPEGRMRWAIWPAGAMFIMGLIFGMMEASALNWIWAGVLIVAGGYLIYRALSGQRR